MHTISPKRTVKEILKEVVWPNSISKKTGFSSCKKRKSPT
jgi:hypothetical protein